MRDTPIGSLAGIRVIDLTRVLGGPYCTQILGDHGADVIKIEPPQGDEVRDWGPPFRHGDASYFIGVNRNKRAFGLDLTHPKGRATLLRLLEPADVLIENFKTGTMERWNLGFEKVLAPRLPRLIHCRISGFGADGPLGGYPGYDAVVQAMTGMFSVNGTPESGPTRIGIPLVDIGTGLYAAVAVLMALLERERSGQGQFIDMSLWDCGMAMMHPHMANFLLSDRAPGPTGNAHTNISPYDKFPTRTVEIFLAVGNNRAFERLCAELGRPDLSTAPRYRTNADRMANRAELTRELQALLADRDGAELAERLLKIGVPAAPVLTAEQAVAHPQTAHRRNLLEFDGYRGIATPIRLSRTPGETRRAPPSFGADVREILAQSGFEPREIDALLADGVVVEERR